MTEPTQVGYRIRLMDPANRFHPFWVRAAWVFLGCAVAAACLLFRQLMAVPTVGEYTFPESIPLPAWPPVAATQTCDWTLFQSVNPQPASEAGSLTKLFRLAGTFLVEGAGAAQIRKAVLDDLRSKREEIVTEGESIDDVKVVRVFRERVVLGRGGREEELWLSFSRPSGSSTSGVERAAGVEAGGLPVLDKFGGTRVGEHRWVFKRDSLIAYYQELRDNPERLLKVFDSLRPLYDNQQKITGYELSVEGEPEFFQATGLEPGDIVRKVNEMPMTNRRRAEFLLNEFIGGRANAFLFDIERGGSPVELRYEIR